MQIFFKKKKTRKKILQVRIQNDEDCNDQTNLYRH